MIEQRHTRRKHALCGWGPSAPGNVSTPLDRLDGGSSEWRSDRSVEEEVRYVLRYAPDLDAQEVQAHVSGREVTLTGNVNDSEARLLAGQVAESVRGVRYVINNLRVRQHGTSGATG